MHRHPARVVEAARLLQLQPNRLRDAAKRWAKSAAHDPAQKSLFEASDTPAQSWAIFLHEGGIAPAKEGAPRPHGAEHPHPASMGPPGMHRAAPASKPDAPKTSGFAAEVLALAAGLPSAARLGATKVYLRAIFEAWPDKALTWEDFARKVLDAQKAGDLRLGDADLVGGVDSRLYDESRIVDGANEWRFLAV
jgi:hypothetical protein